MNQFITLPEFLAIVLICWPALALVKTFIQTIEEKINNQ